MPIIMPIRDLKNTVAISQVCKESNEPIFITKNGYGDMVLMNMKLYEETMAEIQAAKQINESLTEVENGAQPVNGDAFFEKMKVKYADKV